MAGTELESLYLVLGVMAEPWDAGLAKADASSKAWQAKQLAIFESTSTGVQNKMKVATTGVSNDMKKMADATESAAKRGSDALSAHGRSMIGFGELVKLQAKQVGIAMAMMVPVAMIGSAAAAFGTAVYEGLKFNATMEQSQIAFTTMLGSGEAATKMLTDLYQLSATTPYEYPQLVNATQRLLAYGVAANKVVPYLTAIGDATSALGQGPEVINRIVVALGQMQAKGKVTAEEVRQLAEAGIPVWGILAEKMGKTTGQVIKLSEQGLIPARQALEDLTAGMEERFGGMMEKQSKTMTGLLSTLKDYSRQAAGLATEDLFGDMKGGLEGLVDDLARVNRDMNALGFMEAVKKDMPAAYELISAISGAVGAVGDAAKVAAPLIRAFTESFAVEQLQSLNDGLSATSRIIGDMTDITMPATGWSLKDVFSFGGEGTASALTMLFAPPLQLYKAWEDYGKAVEAVNPKLTAEEEQWGDKARVAAAAFQATIDALAAEKQTLLDDAQAARDAQAEADAAYVAAATQRWEKELDSVYSIGGAYTTVLKRNQKAAQDAAAATNAANQRANDAAKRSVDDRADAEIASINKVRDARLDELKAQEAAENKSLSRAERSNNIVLQAVIRDRIKNLQAEQDAVTENAKARTDAIKEAAAAEKAGMDAVKVSAAEATVSLAELTAEMERQSEAADKYIENMKALASNPALVEAIMSSGLSTEQKQQLAQQLVLGGEDEANQAMNVLDRILTSRNTKAAENLALYFAEVKTVADKAGTDTADAFVRALAAGGDRVANTVGGYAATIAKEINPILKALGVAEIPILNQQGQVISGGRPTGAQQYADGGFQPGIYEYQRGGLIKFAEEYDEAYIPLDPKRHSRGVEVWAETGRRLGVMAGGGILSPSQIGTVAKQAGFQDLVTAIAIALAESGGNPLAVGRNKGSSDWGLWQINDKYNKDALALGDWRVPADNARMAMYAYRGREKWDHGAGGGWRDWSSYLNGRYKQFLDEGTVGAAGAGTVQPVLGSTADLLTMAGLTPPPFMDEPGDPNLSLTRVGNAAMRVMYQHAFDLMSQNEPPNAAYGGPSLNDIHGLNPEFLRRFNNWTAFIHSKFGPQLRIDSGYRSVAEQTNLWNNSDKSGKWVARPGRSWHNYGLAIDYGPKKDRSWKYNAYLDDFGLYAPMNYEVWHVQPQGYARPYANGGIRQKTYDQGGLLMPGYTLAYNGTGMPERITSFADGGVTSTIKYTPEQATAAQTAQTQWDAAASSAAVFAARLEYLAASGASAADQIVVLNNEIDALISQRAAAQSMLDLARAAGASQEEINTLQIQVYDLDTRLANLDNSVEDLYLSITELARVPLVNALNAWNAALSQTTMLLDLMSQGSGDLSVLANQVMTVQEGIRDANLALMENATDPAQIAEYGQAAANAVMAMYNAQKQALDQALADQTKGIDQELKNQQDIINKSKTDWEADWQERSDAVRKASQDQQDALNQQLKDLREANGKALTELQKFYSDKLAAMSAANEAESRVSQTTDIQGQIRSLYSQQGLSESDYDKIISLRKQLADNQKKWAQDDARSALEMERDSQTDTLKTRQQAAEDALQAQIEASDKMFTALTESLAAEKTEQDKFYEDSLTAAQTAHDDQLAVVQKAHDDQLDILVDSYADQLTTIFTAQNQLLTATQEWAAAMGAVAAALAPGSAAATDNGTTVYLDATSTAPGGGGSTGAAPAASPAPSNSSSRYRGAPALNPDNYLTYEDAMVQGPPLFYWNPQTGQWQGQPVAGNHISQPGHLFPGGSRAGRVTYYWGPPISVPQVQYFDQGGWLPTGVSLVQNNTGVPERVLPPGGADMDVRVEVVVKGDGTTMTDAQVRELRKGLREDVISELGRQNRRSEYSMS